MAASAKLPAVVPRKCLESFIAQILWYISLGIQPQKEIKKRIYLGTEYISP